ncbi:uncharacterized protein LOC122533207 isoform X3 [Frieseomelitta varia]|uniref:uncharacterized protein LOC122533207 isoform X3 n=1 Tax=Frieseomelitta varia TaxID=561572 RepID=UPI001CB67E8B|nr:uncharacterized protein LOC122533207 isoform X3 [Frieseomelitta varia]
MNDDGDCHTRKYGYLFDNMVIVPSPGSIWDYPYLDQMESPSRFELTKAEAESGEETELGEVKVTLPTSTVATSTPVQPGAIPCRNGGCKSWTSRAESRMESPWHFLKTIFLISVIVALILWIIVYTFLAQYRIL